MRKNVVIKMVAAVLAGVAAIGIAIPKLAGAEVVKCSDPNYVVPVVDCVPAVEPVPVVSVNPVVVPVDPTPDPAAVVPASDTVRVDMHFEGLDNYYFRRETIRIYGRRLYYNNRTNTTYYGNEELIAEQHVTRDSDYYLELGSDVDICSLRIEYDYIGRNYMAFTNSLYVAHGMTANDEIASIALAFTPIEGMAATAAGTCDVTCLHRNSNNTYRYNVIPQAVYNDTFA